MKEIRNQTQRPIQVPLGRDKKLHLGPARTGQVSDDAVELAAFRALIDAGTIEVLGESRVEAMSGSYVTGPREVKHGYHPPTVVMPKGDR